MVVLLLALAGVPIERDALTLGAGFDVELTGFSLAEVDLVIEEAGGKVTDVNGERRASPGSGQRDQGLHGRDGSPPSARTATCSRPA